MKIDKILINLITAAALVLLTAVLLLGSPGRMMNNFAGHWMDRNTNIGATL
jgi:hypothetical protein